MANEATEATVTQRPRGGRRRVWLFRAIALGASLVFAILASEVALRVLRVGYGNSAPVGHPVLHHWNERNYQMLYWGPRGQDEDHIVYFNSDGFLMRDELPPPSEPTLLFLGDSFTYAKEVAEENRFVTLVGEELGIRALNFGNGSFSPLLSRLLLDLYGDRISPQAVVLQLYSNDIEGDAEMRRLAERDESGRIVAVPGSKTSWFTRLARRSYFARLVRKVTLSIQLEQRRRARGASRPRLENPYFTKPLPEWFEGDELEGIGESILEIKQFCDRRGCPFFLFVIPDRGAMLQGTTDYFSEYFAEFCRQHEIEFIDLREAFEGKTVDEIFIRNDIHFKQAGHRIVADYLAKVLRDALPAVASEPVEGSAAR